MKAIMQRSLGKGFYTKAFLKDAIGSCEEFTLGCHSPQLSQVFKMLVKRWLTLFYNRL